MMMIRRMIIGMGINDNDNDVFAARGKSLNSITTSRRLVGALITVGSIGGHSYAHIIVKSSRTRKGFKSAVHCSVGSILG